jgi:hypothetical protein
MNPFEKLLPINLYHSYVIEGDPNITPYLLLEFLKVRGDIENKNPDVLCQIYESFTIDNSGEIKDWHSKSGVTEGKRVCIIGTKFINREAEQALLKIIEEPATDTHFFIIIPDSSTLSTTIISRVHVVKTEHVDDKEIKKEALSFLSVSPKDRIDMVALIIKNNKDLENSGQLRFYAVSFANELESIFYQKFKGNRKDKKIIFILEELQKSRKYLSTSGASVKMILEHLALVI